MKFYGSFFILLIALTLIYGRKVQNPCQRDGKIPCDNGECIDRLDWCNFHDDCADRSDERYCERRKFSNNGNNCTEKHFVCDDGKCIPVSSRCDGEWDCWDDENDCDTIGRDELVTERTEIDEHYLHSSAPTLATEFTTSTSSYGRQSRRSYDNRHYNYPPPTSPSNLANPVVNYDYDTNYDRTYSGYNYGGSGTHSGRQYPGNLQSNVPSRAPESTSRGRPYIQPTSRTRQDSVKPDYPVVNRQSPLLYPPRTIVHVPNIISPGPARRTVRKSHYPHFNFAINYTRDLQYDYERNVQNAKNWLLSQRDDSYLWGRDTPRALIALSLISNSFKSDVDDNEVMKKSFESYLGIKLLRNESRQEIISTTRLAVYINALLATCQDPNNFFGMNLVDVLFKTQNHLEQYQRFVNPLIYLTLCLANKNVPVDYLQTFLRDSFPTEPSKDLHILATTAMACVAQQSPYDMNIKAKLVKAVENLLGQMDGFNGSFGSKYTTALAAQALMSVNTSQAWDYRKTLDYLAREQLPDGSFGDMQLTYYTVLALSGRSLLHLRNTDCDLVGDKKKEWSPEDILNRDGPRKNVFYTLRVGFPETFSASVQLSVPIDTNFFDIMRVAAYQDSTFKFNYEYSRGQLGIHTIANIPNDPERGMFWALYKLPSLSTSFDLRSKYLGDPGTLIPQDGDELLFWYLSDFLSY